ncbi:hypothetical protein [Aminobacter sp. SS-2016]|uniref:hypothetical protein n=1 Tax=Aminobacter sp. Y103A TaxID=1870862 RepID=UPI002572A65C|nr:hypothetical protein [Aminobacter sp. SS-2016]
MVDRLAGNLPQNRVKPVNVVVQERVGLVERLQADEALLDCFAERDRGEDNRLDLALGQFFASFGSAWHVPIFPEKWHPLVIDGDKPAQLVAINQTWLHLQKRDRTATSLASFSLDRKGHCRH